MFALHHRLFFFAFVSLASVACTQETEGSKEPPEPTTSESPITSPASGAKLEAAACPEIDVPACGANDELVTGVDENGCSYAYCKPPSCPPVDVPQCQPGEEVVTGIDENGCGYGYCKPPASPPSE